MTHVDTYLPHFKPQIAQLSQIIKDNQSFLIVGHTSPDGDCLGSMLALGRYLEKLGKEVNYTASRQHQPSLNWVWCSEQIQYFTDNDQYSLPTTQVVVFVDHSSFGHRSDMKELMTQYIQDKVTVCIDHHLRPNIINDCPIIDESSSSASELLREILAYLDSSGIDNEIASLCLLGLITDTGGSVGLEHEKDSIRSFENALDMLKHGADKKTIIDKLNTIGQNDLILTQRMFERINYFEYGIRTWAEENDRLSLGLDLEALHVFNGIIKKVENIDIVARFTIIDGDLYGSLRTSNERDVQAIAAQFGGGGHKFAAGFKLTDKSYTKDLIALEIIPKINELMREQLAQ